MVNSKRPKTRPRHWQHIAVKFGLKHKTWGLFAEMGLGKTFMAILWILKSRFKKIAVVCRNDDLMTWEDEITTHSNLTFVNVCKQKKRDKRAEALDQNKQIYLMTYDSVKQLQLLLPEMDWDCVICDESTEIKRPSSKKTKILLKVFGRIPYRLAMTGTPITNTPMDAFTQMLFIDGGKAFGTNWWRFRNTYFWPCPNSHQWFILKGSRGRIRKKIYQSCIRFRKKDCLDLPPKVYLIKKCTMTPKQARIYKEIVKEFEITLDSGEKMELDYAVQQFVKMLQVTGGFYYTPDGPVDLPCGKLNTLKRMLDLNEFRRTKKIVIWANFNREIRLIKRVANELGYKSIRFWKHTKDREKARRRFRDEDDLQLWIAGVRSGVGMNELRVSDTVIYYSRSTRLINRMQSEDRTHRIGSEIHKRIRYFDLVVPGTVDERVYNLLRQARDVASRIIDGKSVLNLIPSIKHITVSN